MEILTFRQFCARRGYDVEISHDRLRFPHGISKRQARDNRKAAIHHLGEVFRAGRDYQTDVDAGVIRPPTDAEEVDDRLAGHPDHGSVKATWRVRVRRMRRLDPNVSELDAVRRIVESRFGGLDPFHAEFGVPDIWDVGAVASARLVWMNIAGDSE